MKRKRISHSRSLVVLVVLGGMSAAGQTWQPAGELPTAGAARVYAAGVNHNGTLYAIGGSPWQNGGDQDGAVHRLVGGTWSAVAALDGMGPIIGGGAGVDGLGRIIVYGGYIDGDGGPGEAKIYDPIQGPNTNIAERRAPESSIGLFAWARDGQGRLYGFGGGPGEGGPNSGYCDRYDAATDSWSVLASMPTPAADACAVYDGAGHMLVIGGIDAAADARLANVAQYDIASNTWSDVSIPDLPVALSGARAALGADGRVYVLGGESGPIGASVSQSAVYKLDLGTNSWTAVASMATPRKWFACVLGSDDFLYAIGGDNDAGGTNAVEKLFTPRCPTITGQPASQAAWRGTIAGFTVVVAGATPMTFQWRKDGAALVDGPTAGGSTISGSATATLSIAHPGGGDLGEYDVLVSNACGDVTSAAATLTLREPPNVSTNWTVTNLHPLWADGSSYANGISGGRIGGAATMTTTLPDTRVMSLSHPILWDEQLQPADITPAGSVGGGVNDIDGEILGGWFWHTWQCWAGGQYWTCAWQSACFWSGSALLMDEVHMSGAEYDAVYAVAGTSMVGTATYEYSEGNYASYAHLWRPPNYGGVSLHPAGASHSSASAIDGEQQYGHIFTPNPGPVARAASWSGSGSTFVDMHPAGYTRSSISGAGDGQAVGTAWVGDAGHAGLWVGGAFVDLNPQNSTSSLVAVDEGVQVGQSSTGASLWIGTADSIVHLDDFLPPEFSGGVATDVEVAADGTIRVAGYGYNSATSRYEALLWRSAAECPADLNGDGSVSLTDLAMLLAHFGTSGGATANDGDIDGDQDVDLTDLSALLAQFGTTCS